MTDWPYGTSFKFGEHDPNWLSTLLQANSERCLPWEKSMRKNSVQCDACCKAHPVDDEYDVSHLPGPWYTVIPGQGGGFKETMHFCSTKCSLDWLEKQILAKQGVTQEDCDRWRGRDL